ncbi:hypothetical protein [Natronorubrum sp. FCH18a]|uniref:hypothetical protein n=1 Tax=Natronorubrum sp. FCH18a TaxID=3447018 RepID=UPI003F50DDA3
MTNTEQLHGATADRAIADGETYVHAEHGRVEITGIWQQTQRIRRIDATRNGDERDMIVVRFIPGEDGEWIDGLAEPLDDFLDAID